MVNELLRNETHNGWIVQKFGGTSVGKFPDKIAEDIIRYVEALLHIHRGIGPLLTV